MPSSPRKLPSPTAAPVQSSVKKSALPSGAWPVSSIPALQLQRPLEVFGAKFAVYVSSALTLHPDTVARAVLGTSLQKTLRSRAPAQYSALKKLLYVAKTKLPARLGTKNLLLKELGQIISPELLTAALDRQGPEYSALAGDEWKELLKGMDGCAGELFHDIATCLAACDLHMRFMQSLLENGHRAEAEAHFKTLFSRAQDAWISLEPRLAFKVMLQLEVALMTLAWVECEGAVLGGKAPAQPGSAAATLLDVGRRPLGHWLREVCDASRCASLGALSDALLLQGATYHGEPISHHLLKKWSSSKSVAIPRIAVAPVLKAVRVKGHVERLENRFYVARLLTFLCDLARSGMVGAPVQWGEVQAHIKSRYTAVYRLEVERRLVTPA